MLLPRPILFEEALDSRRVKALLPTTASSSELARIPAELRERAFFSARTASAAHLARTDALINRILQPIPAVQDPATGEWASAAPGEYMNEAKARQLMRASLRSIGYDPAAIGAEPGSLQDLASFNRIHLIIDTNVKMARNYGNWKQGQSTAILDQWPAQELIRVEAREERRDWHRTWVQAGGRVFPGAGLDGRYGRMIALKNAPIWTSINRFGLPYPPFDYNSGVGVQDVDRDEAVRLKVISEDDQVAPQDRGFNDSLQASSPADPAGQPALFQAIAAAMGARVSFTDGVLHFLEAVNA